MKRKSLFIFFFLIIISGCSPVFEVIDEHPRILFRNSEWDGISINDIRERCRIPEYGCDYAIGNPNNKTITTAKAIRYLITGNKTLAEEAKNELLKNNFTCRHSHGEYTDLPGYSASFDWIYNYENFSEKEKSKVNKKIQECAWILNDQLEKEGPHLFHGRTELASNLMISALAQDGDKKLVAAAKKHLWEAFKAWEYLDGAWAEGMNYFRNRIGTSGRMEMSMHDALLSIYSATGFDIFEHIKEEQGNWFERNGLFHIYMIRPDMQWHRIGDMPNMRLKSHGEFNRHLELIASEYDNSYVQMLADQLSFCNQSMHCFPYSKPVKYDITLEKEEFDSLPSSAIFGKESLGIVFIKSDWTENRTDIVYIAGDWHTGHQHFASGSFILFKRSPLAVESGEYTDWGTDHRENYYIRTVAHNSLLICKPDEKFNVSISIGQTNDCGQRVIMNRSQIVETLEEHIEDLDKKRKETGDLINFYSSNSFDYINSDITKAYSEKASLVTRQIIYLKEYDSMIIFDRINSTNKTYEKKFLLHSINKPITKEEKVLEGSFEAGILLTDSMNFTIETNESALFAETIFPEKTKTIKIGGEGYRFYSDGKNREIKEGDHTYPSDRWTYPDSWRLEVSPSEERRFDSFLHVLSPRIEKEKADIRTVPAEGKNTRGILLNKTLILFSRTGNNLDEADAILNSSADEFIISNLFPNKTYLIKIKNNNNNNISYSSESNSDGILHLKFKEKKISKIILRKL